MTFRTLSCGSSSTASSPRSFWASILPETWLIERAKEAPARWMRSTFSAWLTRAITGTWGASSFKITVAKRVALSLSRARITARARVTPASSKSRGSRTSPARSTPGPGWRSITRTSSPTTRSSSTTFLPTSPKPPTTNGPGGPGGCSPRASSRHPLDARLAADDDQHPLGFEPEGGIEPGAELPAQPLADHRDPGPGADRRLFQGLTGERAPGLDPHLGDRQGAAERLHPGEPRIDPGC